MPPLRDRDEDVIEIAEAALHRFAAEEGRAFTKLSPDVRALFRRLSWPGNVRQVLNVMRNVAVLYDGAEVQLHMLPDTITDLPASATPARPSPPPPAPPALTLDALLGLPLAEVERQIIEATIAMHAGSVPRAARVLDVSPSTLYRKLESWAKPGKA
jgi:DNA-binding NtrC family response regulator